MALADTTQFGIKSLRDDYLADTIKMLLDNNIKANIREDMRSSLKYHTWEQTALYWEQIIGRFTRSSSGNRKELKSKQQEI